MANRDRSQGFGFVYLDLAKFVAQRNELDKKHGAPYPSSDVPSIKFGKEIQSAPVAAPIESNSRSQAIGQIRENLDRLQALHHKLHAMLEELNQITNRDKKKSDEK